MKVIFLDIDGVLQPYNSKGRFEINRLLLCDKLSKMYDRNYTIYDEYDVAASYMDWDLKGVERIRTILEKTGAKIVISSDWKREKMPKMWDFFAFYGLDKYIVGQTLPRDTDNEKAQKEVDEIQQKLSQKYQTYVRDRIAEIYQYLIHHEEITNFITIDDMDLVLGFKEHCVTTDDIITEEEMELAIELLNSDRSKVHSKFIKDLDNY